VVPLAGTLAVRLLADRVGLIEGLSTALARRGFVPVHDRGQVWVDVATMLAAGGEAIADIDALRHQIRPRGLAVHSFGIGNMPFAESRTPFSTYFESRRDEDRPRTGLGERARWIRSAKANGSGGSLDSRAGVRPSLLTIM
jgi:hypothetical protein